MGTVGGRVDGLEKNIDLAPDVKGGEMYDIVDETNRMLRGIAMPTGNRLSIDNWDRERERDRYQEEREEETRNNIIKETKEAIELLNPFNSGSERQHLETFVARLEQIAAMVSEILGKQY